MTTLNYDLQYQFLTDLVEQKTPVSIFLQNGICLKGVIDSFDNEVFLLKTPTSMIVYKHAISTIVPESQSTKEL